MKIYKLCQVIADVKIALRVSSDRSPDRIYRLTNTRLNTLKQEGFTLEPDYDQSRALSFVAQCVETSPPFQTRFKHWRVWSEKRNAILCVITKNAEYTPRIYPAKELGLFWEFQSLDSEFVYLPAIWPRDSDGKILITSEMEDDFPSVVAHDRKENYQVFHNFRKTHFNQAYSIRYHFKKTEAIAFAALLKQINRGTEDFDDSAYIEEYTPSLLQILFEWGTGSVRRI